MLTALKIIIVPLLYVNIFILAMAYIIARFVGGYGDRANMYLALAGICSGILIAIKYTPKLKKHDPR